MSEHPTYMTRASLNENILDIMNYVDDLEKVLDKKNKKIESLIKEISLLEVRLEEISKKGE